MPVVVQRLAVCQHKHTGTQAFNVAGLALLTTSIDREFFLKQQQQQGEAAIAQYCSDRNDHSVQSQD